MELLVFLLLLSGVVGAVILNRHNKAGTGCVLGLLLGPIGWIIAAVMRSNAQAAEAQKRHEESLAQMAAAAPPDAPVPAERIERDCPFCAEPILAKAKVCKHCGREVEAEIRAQLKDEIRADLEA